MSDQAPTSEPLPTPAAAAADNAELEPPQPAAPSTTPANTAFDSWKSWGSNWMQTVGDKTLSTLELVKKDLNEFSDTVTQEATAIATATSDVVKQQAHLFHQFVTTPDGELPPDFRTDEEKAQDAEEKDKTIDDKTTADDQAKPGESLVDSLKSPINDVTTVASGWMKSLVETVQKLAVEDTTADEGLYTEEITLGPARKSLLTPQELQQIQSDTRTFLTPPPDKLQDRYTDWLETFKLSEYDGEINALLSTNPRLRELYARTVPAELDNHVFWYRYFFKVAAAEDEKATKQKPLAVNTKDSKNDKKSPAGSDGTSTDKEETWSMCSSTTAESLRDQVSESEAGPLTPKIQDAADGWENFDATTDA